MYNLKEENNDPPILMQQDSTYSPFPPNYAVGSNQNY